MLEDLHIGVPVTGSDGKRLGTLTRIVVERDTFRVTRIVVDPGLVESGNLLAAGGWEKPRERVLPFDVISSASEHGVRVSIDESGFAAQPLFEHKEYTAAEVSDTVAGGPRPQWWERFRVGELVNFIASGWGLGAAPYLPPADITYNEPPGASAIAEGTRVWRLEPHVEVGVVERVLADPASQRITGVVVRREGLRGERRILPVSAIADVQDGTLHTRLSDAEFDALPPYHEQS
jgi:sporulation protein YlmC with PRC-barrel domain